MTAQIKREHVQIIAKIIPRGHPRGIGGNIITLYRALFITLFNKYAFLHIK